MQLLSVGGGQDAPFLQNANRQDILDCPSFPGRQKSGFLKGRLGRMYPRSAFRSGGTCECTLVPVFVPGEHPNVPSFLLSFRGFIRQTHPFPKPPFCEPPIVFSPFSSYLRNCSCFSARFSKRAGEGTAEVGTGSPYSPERHFRTRSGLQQQSDTFRQNPNLAKSIWQNPSKSGQIGQNPAISSCAHANPSKSSQIRQNPSKSGQIRQTSVLKSGKICQNPARSLL